MLHWLQSALLVAAAGCLSRGVTQILEVRRQRRAWRNQQIVSPYGEPGSIREGVYLVLGGLALLSWTIALWWESLKRP
jgi:hypothetical protein